VTHAPTRSTLRVATYNIHRCRGLDGRTRPDRIAAVLRAIDADVVALQEVIGAGPTTGGHAEEIGAALGMGWVMAPARHLRGHQFGNAVLSRLPITHHVEHDLSWKTCEPRRLQRVDIAAPGGTLHIYNVHLGTAILERRHQAQRLTTIVTDRHVGGPKLVLGDFNEWMRGLATKMLTDRLHSVDPAQSPAPAPHLPRALSDPASRSHLLRRPPRDRQHRAAADTAVAGRLGSPAAGRRCQASLTRACGLPARAPGSARRS
jgi:endonuclease/exonuclease/phosphatase family metal-dependent hydrolase